MMLKLWLNLNSTAHDLLAQDHDDTILQVLKFRSLVWTPATAEILNGLVTHLQGGHGESISERRPIRNRDNFP